MPSDTPLLTSSPHKLVPSLEFNVCLGTKAQEYLSDVAAPRLFSTHVPYSSLPESIKASKCRIVYICRNPLDVLLSFWHFAAQDHPNRDETSTMEDCAESFCKGNDLFGPLWDHAVGIWKESLERPEKVLFLKYEEMKEDTALQAKKFAEFVGFPFSQDEEKNGVIQKICELCSLNSLKELDVKNTYDPVEATFKSSYFYRKGEVGGWVDELSPSTAERLEKVIHEKLRGSDLTFKTSL